MVQNREKYIIASPRFHFLVFDIEFLISMDSKSTNLNVTPVDQEVTHAEAKQYKPARYVPPGRRSSPTSTSSDEKPVPLHEPLVLPTSQQQVSVTSLTRSRESNTSSQPGTRTPSPEGKTPTVAKDSQTGEPVQIWQGKRRGGNRAPKIEPAGTKTWRESKKKVERSADLTPFEGESTPPPNSNILVRLVGYLPILLDAIDLHLNVLIRCIAPEAQSVSVRDIPRHLFPAINGKRLVTELSTKNYSMGIPGTISIVDFFRILSVTLDLFGAVGLQHLPLLLDCERISNPISRTYNFSELLETVFSLAAAQLNWACCKDLSPVPSRDDSPISMETRRKILNFREEMLHTETQSVTRFFMQDSLHEGNDRLRDAIDLANEHKRGNVTEDYSKMWGSCLRVRCSGLLEVPPHYPDLMVKVGFVPGERGPMQLRHAKEPGWMYGTVCKWLDLKEGVEEILPPPICTTNFCPLTRVR